MQNKLKEIKEIDKKADIFIDGNVIARNLINSDGQSVSLGFVLSGEYEIDIEDSETVEVLGGDFTILLPNSSSYEKYNEGDKFYIPKKSTYKLKVNDYFDYYCIFGL